MLLNDISQSQAVPTALWCDDQCKNTSAKASGVCWLAQEELPFVEARCGLWPVSYSDLQSVFPVRSCGLSVTGLSK
jgi:hypothetical protein